MIKINDDFRHKKKCDEKQQKSDHNNDLHKRIYHEKHYYSYFLCHTYPKFKPNKNQDEVKILQNQHVDISKKDH
ncbi:hypothetical protein [Clostridium sp. CF012]|uniref:hypothetical protein n=1 Tax=Clostridium sp. CF012 TaxID=2843319 RepID=UPI001C0C837C|nr:hypothetical protein [Clostridium sp. CF012]MBU3145693.1 hypothetical protein [Clostridium sp. CF012]